MKKKAVRTCGECVYMAVSDDSRRLWGGTGWCDFDPDNGEGGFVRPSDACCMTPRRWKPIGGKPKPKRGTR
jgi:hypothetical protein